MLQSLSWRSGGRQAQRETLGGSSAKKEQLPGSCSQRVGYSNISTLSKTGDELKLFREHYSMGMK